MSRAARPWLAPLVPLYRLAVGLRAWRLEHGWERVERLGWPVVSVGNLSAGGAGKTPFTIALAQALTRRGVPVDVLSRGYGRTSQSPARVDPEGSPETFGDEPLLIARATGAPVYVAPRRYDAGSLAELDQNKKKIHLLDDGFQHRQLERDLNLLLVSRVDLEDALLPAGNLREPLTGLGRASVVVVPAEDAEIESRLQVLGWKGPVWRIRRRMEVPALAGPVVAFCGIARPEQFFSGLEKNGVKVAARKVFRDHRPYREADIGALSALAGQHQAELLTTEKDAVRMGPLAEKFSVPLHTAPLITEIEDEAAGIDWLLGQLKSEK
jgi:tetraacyldisaccharide 4'-kinase